MTATIVALASGRPPAAIAIVRLSGPGAHAAVTALVARGLPPPRRAALRRLADPRDGTPLDDALVLRFDAPASATGEDAVELHLHGGSAVVSGVIDALVAQPDVRLAEPGEFTRRGFANGRLDLAQVEGLADLVAAETAAQRRQALALAGGALSRVAETWRERCLAILAEAEAGLDFAEDEADVAAQLALAARSSLAAMAGELDDLLADAGRAARLRDGLTIVVSGPPNVGKSSLVNALSRLDAAIVTPLAGTTRDAIEVPIDLDGVAAVLVDTAGLRDTDDPIEAEGIRRARARAAAADLVLSLGDFELPALQHGDVPTVLVITKHDLGTWAPREAVHVSTLSGLGIGELRRRLAQWAHNAVRPGQAALLGQARHREAFAAAAAAIHAAATTEDEVLRAEHLRAAAQAFGRIAGRVGIEDVLDRVFARFCIGK